MKHTFKMLCAAALLTGFAACSNDDPDWTVPQQEPSRAPETMETLWRTSPLDADLTTRRELFATIQGYADACSGATFSSFLNGAD